MVNSLSSTTGKEIIYRLFILEEKENATGNEGEDRKLEQLIDRIIVDKDEQAMLDFLSLFEEDIDVLSRYMRMPKEDAIQWLKLGLMEIVLQRT